MPNTDFELSQLPTMHRMYMHVHCASTANDTLYSLTDALIRYTDMYTISLDTWIANSFKIAREAQCFFLKIFIRPNSSYKIKLNLMTIYIYSVILQDKTKSVQTCYYGVGIHSIHKHTCTQ
jgi:hypothetical protein